MYNENSPVVVEHEGRAFIASWEIAKAFDIAHDEVLRSIQSMMKTNGDWDLLESRDVYHLDERKKCVYHGYLIKRELFRLIATDFAIPRQKMVKVTKQISAQFDEAEKRLRPKDYSEMLSKYIEEVDFKESIKELEKQNKLLQSQIDSMKPKVIYADAVLSAGRCIQIGELAKMMRKMGMKMDLNKLLERMRHDGYLNSEWGEYNMPSAFSAVHDLFKIREKAFVDVSGTISVIKTVLVTSKGQQFFINHYKEDK